MVATQTPGPAPTFDAPAAGQLTAKKSVLAGHSGRLSWRIDSYRFAGGQGATEVNRRVRASAQDCVTRGRREASGDRGERRTVTGESVLTTNDGRTVQVALVCVDFLAGTAHPSYWLGTTAVTTDGDPIALSDVFPDERAAFGQLAPLVRKAARIKDEGVSEADGLAPREASWANWQTSSKGMVFYFGDDQLGGHGYRVYTTPWSQVRPLMSRSAVQLLAPR